ncbi:MAG: AMP-binding protein [Crocinitomicaceae bacterium]|nr:AMP-binding protein [Crocinitomicaceae bacterium]
MQLEFRTQNKTLINDVNTFIKEWHSSASTVTVTTSGSTGTPKAIELRKHYMIESAKMTGKFLGLKAGDHALLCLSPNTIAGKMMIVRSIILGLKLIVTDINSHPLKEIDERIDFIALVPLQLKNTLQNLREQLSAISSVIVGGGAISNDLRVAAAQLPNKLFQTFGMTETISHVALREVREENNSYHALPGVHFSIEKGNLVIHAPYLGIEHLLTNDSIEILSDHEFKWLGRSDFVINSGGIKIHPEEIESQLSELIVSPFFSVGLDDETLGQKHVLCIEGNKENKLNKTSFRLLSAFLIPKEIYYFDSFAYTESNKINRMETLKFLVNAKKKVL